MNDKITEKNFGKTEEKKVSEDIQKLLKGLAAGTSINQISLKM